MAAIIRSTVSPVAHPVTGVARGTVNGASRDDLYVGDAVTLLSVNTAGTYAWTLAYRPPGSTAAFSGSALAQSPGFITVDREGPYLIRLTVDLGQPTESTQFVRLRYLTDFGQLRLVSAGEQNNSGIPVPVDQSAQGWADAQNTNLTTLLGLIAKVSTSGRVLYVDQNGSSTDTILGYADFDNIQDAIDEAVSNGPTLAEPWVVLVRPGLYTEDLAFAPHVHVYGWPGTPEGDDQNRVARIRSDTAFHTAALAGVTDHVFLANLTFEHPINGTDPAIVKSGVGSLHIYRCAITNQGSSASQGPALRVTAGFVEVIGSQLLLNPGAGTDRPALRVLGSTTTVELTDTVVTGPTGAIFEIGSTVTARDTRFNGTAGAGAAASIISDALALTLDYCTVRAPLVVNPLRVHPSAAALIGSVALTMRWTYVDGGILYDTTGVTGTTTLLLGSCEYSTLSFPGGSPTTFAATTKAATLFYDNTVSGLTAENVQDAIDELQVLATAVRTLDDAYDAGGGGPGTGRDIIADAGAVRILDAAAPSEPVPPSNTDGRLQVVGNVEVGSIGKPEIDLDPNPFGGGPLVRLGRLIQANNTPWGSTAFILGQSTGAPDHNNYNLRVQTESSFTGGRIGRLTLRGGDGLANGVTTPLPGPIYVQAGSAQAGPNDGADVFLVPGDGLGAGGVGSLILVRPQNATPATLTAGGAFVGGVAGTIRFAIDMVAIEVAILAGDTLVAVLAKFDATGHVTAAHVLGVITLTTVATGENAEIHFLNDTVGGSLDTALGGFDGQSQVDGTWPSTIAIRVTGTNEISIGVGGATGPLVYNSDTGKLTVPGIIDPIGLVLDQTVPLVADPGKGVIFIGDGTGGTIVGNFYYRFGGGALQDISAVVGGSTGFTVKDEGTTVPNGPFTILNFTGSGVVAADAGGGQVNVTITSAGGVQGVAQEMFNASAFTFGGGVSSVALGSTLNTAAAVQGLILLARNGLLDMVNVGPALPTTADQYRLSGGNLQIGTDITTSSNAYRVVYPTP
jgi:hypothetical protein